MKLLYTFLVKRPIDKEPWPVVFENHERAEKYPCRASDVYQTMAIERTPVNVPEGKKP